MSKVVLVTSVSGVFGRRTSIALARAGHTVFAGIHERRGMKAITVDCLMALADEASVDLRPVKFDVLSRESVQASIQQIISETGRIDAIVQDFGYRVSGPAVAFTAAQLAQLYGLNLMSVRAVSEAVLPHFRRQRQGLIVWISNISAAGTTPSNLKSAFAKANMESVTDAQIGELRDAGIDICTVLPIGFSSRELGSVASSSAAHLADAVTSLVDAPSRQRPYRIQVDPIEGRVTADFHRTEATTNLRPHLRLASKASATIISLEAHRRRATATWRLPGTGNERSGEQE